MRAHAVIYFLVLFIFAGTLAYSFVSLGNRLDKQYQLMTEAIKQGQ